MMMNDRIPDEKRDILIMRLRELVENGTLRMRDWCAIYDIFIDASKRAEAEAYEDYMLDSLNGGVVQ